MSMQGIGEPLSEALLAQSGWARRLARHLVSDTHADDLVQDALEAGLRRPPAADRPLRGWLATVLRHLALNRRAADQRRQMREQQVAADEPTAASPEQALATVQLHRQLGRLIEKLPAEERRVVVLRYFEERSSAEIGALLGVPAATVRWRLGRALDQLRAGLDEESGGSRRRWVLALAPLVRAPSSLAPGLAFGLPLAAGLLIAAGATLLMTARPRPGSATLGVSPPVSAARSGGEPPGGATLAATAAPAAVSSCPDALARLRTELTDIEQDLRQYEDPALYFEKAPPRPDQNARWAAVLAEFQAQDPSGVLECREAICRILFVHHPDVVWKTRDGRPIARLLEGQDVKLDGGKVGGITRDPLSGELQQKHAQYLRLRREPPPIPNDPSACERERARLTAELVPLRERQLRAVIPPVQFARSTNRNRGAETSVRDWLVGLAGARARSLSLECRDQVCRFDPVPDWLAELQRRPEWGGRLSGAWHAPGGDKASYHFLRTPRPAGERDNLHEFWVRVRAATMPVMKACAERHTEAEQVAVTLLFPGLGELNADGVAERPSLRLAGSGADGSFGSCLRKGLTAALATVPVEPGPRARESKTILRGTRPAP